MVKSYLRHGPTQAFGLVCSASSNSVFDGRNAYVPALEDVLVWDVKKGEMMAMWHETGHRAEVTCIVRSPQRDFFAVGYADGSIRLWNSISTAVVTVFNGHKKAVTALAFDEQGVRLASGSQDTDLIVWDVVAEAGLYRLRGHRDQITAIRFLSISDPQQPSSSTTGAPGLLLTSSKDTFIKLWDLATHHCIQTVVAHRSEVWTLDLNPEQDLIFSGSSEGEVKAWKIDREAAAGGLKETDSGEIVKIIHPIANLPLNSTHRVSQIQFHPTQPYVALQSHDRSVEVFRIRTEEEIKKKIARRRKRAKEKKEKEGGSKKNKGAGMDVDEGVNDVPFIDKFTPHVVIRAGGKIRSFDFALEPPNAKAAAQLFLALNTNTFEVFNIPPPSKSKEEPPEATRTFSVHQPGHRTDVRALCLSSDDRILASASNGSLKIWNLKTTACIRTMDCGYAVCSVFLPGDRHVAVGTKSGEILLFDIASSSLIETIQAHSGTVWSLHLRKDGKALVSGSADKDVKFWEFEEKESSENNAQSGKLLSLVHIRTLKMSDDVLSVRYSPDGRFLAVALLDSTVKVFYQDTLKFFLSLYGHKLPVLSMDISDDSKLIVTCSADKNVKIWGLDFGDCHKSIFAHEDSVMQVAFEKDSHYFWTVGKDKMLKYWDGDKFEGIQKLEGHHGEVWALAVSHFGNFVVTGSSDKSIRVWEKLDEPLFLEEEREKELERLYENGIAETLNAENAPIGSGAEDGAPATSAEAEVAAVTKQTTETLMAGERIMEALDLADKERETFREYEEAMSKLSEDDAMRMQPPPRNPVLAAYDVEPDVYVLQVVEKIPSTALHDALLVLPFGKVISLMGYLNLWAQKNRNIPLVSRILFFLLKTHHNQVAANRTMRTILIPLRRHLRAALQRQKDIIGYNLAALNYIRNKNEAERTTEYYEEAGLDEEKVRAKIAEGKKRKRVVVVT
ncbi:WD-repeat-containing protein [Coprinopsis cinerea okayama7|uniref:WD-repeat-containing protein n=1 Tax=Coprinopsis cinerea (strain Okayama-7 / 130 / ATCC MYA-4618 / FGSC 9003) TaxID=240176 RepID=A8NX65_COPC7|nr:WD-repeat-containing protein [Coprinopsis cinerea okayama7\|eukprot:XP_001837080.2 WD-repeat-containing protein [Coprinopsis cinerea okayama7\